MAQTLTWRQRLFINAFLADPKGDACRAAKAAGYRNPEAASCQLMRNPLVRWAVEGKLRSCALSADEVLARYSEVAQFDQGEFVEFEADEKGNLRPYFDLEKLKRSGKFHMVKKLKIQPDGGIEIEFHDSQAALDKLAKNHGLFAPQRLEIEHINGPSGSSERLFAVIRGIAELQGTIAPRTGIGEEESRALGCDSFGGEMEADAALETVGSSPLDVGGEDNRSTGDNAGTETRQE